MSKPALNALPEPVTIIARTLSSRSHVSMAARKSASSWSEREFIFSGRFRVSIASAPSCSSFIVA